jgi:NitT/TauT family transport system substrate-binding protein
VPVADAASGPTVDLPTAGYGSSVAFARASPGTVTAFQRALRMATAEARDRSKVEPLLFEFAKIDKETAAQAALLTFRSDVEAQRLQRVPDLLLEFGVINERIDASAMIAPPPRA